jgi:predicted TIM-barrel fold metal-dependent hydrolase
MSAQTFLAMECVFGMYWCLEQISPWVLSMVELFGPARCMFGSHLPIAKLSPGFDRIYAAYQQIVADFSVDEKDQMFRQVAADWFAIKMRPV